MTDEREAPRSRVILAGTLVHMGAEFPCRVRDVSAAGCRVESDAAFAPATPLHIELSRFGRFPAVVAWAEGRLMGLVFPEGAAGALARFGDSAANLGIAAPSAGTGG